MTDPRAADVPFRRVAVTVPPDEWFHSIAKAMFEAYRQGFVDLGVRVADVPVEPFIANDPVRIRRIADDLRSFQPDVAVGLPKGSYALAIRGFAARRPRAATDCASRAPAGGPAFARARLGIESESIGSEYDPSFSE